MNPAPPTASSYQLRHLLSDAASHLLLLTAAGYVLHLTWPAVSLILAAACGGVLSALLWLASDVRHAITSRPQPSTLRRGQVRAQLTRYVKPDLPHLARMAGCAAPADPEGTGAKWLKNLFSDTITEIALELDGQSHLSAVQRIAESWQKALPAEIADEARFRDPHSVWQAFHEVEAFNEEVPPGYTPDRMTEMALRVLHQIAERLVTAIVHDAARWTQTLKVARGTDVLLARQSDPREDY